MSDSKGEQRDKGQPRTMEERQMCKTKTYPQIIMRRLPLLDHAEPKEPRIGRDEAFHALEQRHVQYDGVHRFFPHHCKLR